MPVSDFAGRLGVSALLMGLMEPIVEWKRDASGWLAVYGVMAVMETLAFAAVFDPPDRLVAVTGGAAMGVFAVPAAVLTLRRRPARSSWPARRQLRRYPWRR
ncbi:hypothetical protein OHR68_41990 [Spirillospora sp. NBC_00431]